eukprot:TRINITY_DN7806_c0_g1_i2.p8 TRINITY_DN7806_c0_g1~~TRINITY_DN7806_c0_g1_i2.p8  ORF type:complete len:100 (+),score=2.91 TRINITY_DN7806_c0_g1_i2:499-798(+)
MHCKHTLVDISHNAMVFMQEWLLTSISSNALIRIYMTRNTYYSDVAIVQPIDSCNLPKPKMLSMGPSKTLDTIRNSGVIVFNVEEYVKTKEEFFSKHEE